MNRTGTAWAGARLAAPRRPAEDSRPPAAARRPWPGEAWLVPPPVEAYVLQAPDAASLTAAAARIADLAPSLSDTELHDLACQLGRVAAPPGGCRLGIVASGQAQLAALARQAARLVPAVRPGQFTARQGIFAGNGARGRVTLLFPGLGTGQGTAGTPGACALPPMFGLTDPQALHPAVLHASLSALRWLDRLGVMASAAVGHSLGEIAALVWAGCLTEADATRLVAQRSAVIRASGTRQTAMVSVAADTAASKALCAGTGLVIAAYNGPASHVLAGPAAGVREVTRRAQQQGIKAVVLDVSHAFHSPAMARCVAPLHAVLGDIALSPPRRRVVSSVTGRAIMPGDDIARLLCAELVSPVRFTEALGAVAADADLLCETGPGHALATLAGQACDVPAVSLQARTGEDRGAAQAAAALFAAGAVNTLEPVLAGRPARPVEIWPQPMAVPAQAGGDVTASRASQGCADVAAPVLGPGTASAAAAGAIPSQPDGPAAGAVPSQPDGPAAGAVPQQPDSGAASAVPSQPDTSGAGAVPQQPNTSGAGAVPQQPDTGAASVVPQQPDSGAASAVPSQPDSPAAGAGPSQPDGPAAGTAPSQPDGPAAAVVPQQPDSGAAGALTAANAPGAASGGTDGAAPAGTARGRADGAAAEVIPITKRDPARPVLRGRFLADIRLHRPGAELVADSRLALRSDPYLADYLIDGRAGLPAVVGLEAMAQAASVLAGRPVRRAAQVSFGRPVILPSGSDQRILIRVWAKREGQRVSAVLRSRQDGQWVDHARASFPLRADSARVQPAANGHPIANGKPGANGSRPTNGSGPAAVNGSGAAAVNGSGAAAVKGSGAAAVNGSRPAWWTFGKVTGILDGADLYGTACFQAGRFRRVAFLPELTSRRCRALVRGGDDQPWFAPPGGPADAPLVLGSPGLNDATLHVLQACFPLRRVLPAGCDAVTVSGRHVPGAVEVRAWQRAVISTAPGGGRPGPFPAGVLDAADEYLWDVAAVDAQGHAVVTWTGLRLRDAGPVPGHPPLPPALLGVYLERGATALGLDPDLRISVRCEQPRIGPAGAGPAGAGPAAARAAAVTSRRPGWVSAHSAGQLGGLSLRLRGASPSACAWETADADQDATGQAADDGAPELQALRQRMRDSLGEPVATVRARIRTAVQCLSSAGRPAGPDLVMDGCYGNGWALLHAGDALIACASVPVAGVSSAVVVSIMTGSGMLPAGAA